MQKNWTVLVALASRFKMDWDDAKGLCLCRPGGEENYDEKARFHGGHLVGTTELGLCLVLSQCSQSPEDGASHFRVVLSETRSEKCLFPRRPPIPSRKPSPTRSNALPVVLSVSLQVTLSPNRTCYVKWSAPAAGLTEFLSACAAFHMKRS